MNETLKVLKLNFNILHFITTDEPINIVIYSQNRAVTGTICYTGYSGMVDFLLGAFAQDNGKYNHSILTGEAVVIITEDNVFITHDFSKFKKYINYEEISLNDDLVQINVGGILSAAELSKS